MFRVAVSKPLQLALRLLKRSSPVRIVFSNLGIPIEGVKRSKVRGVKANLAD